MSSLLYIQRCIPDGQRPADKQWAREITKDLSGAKLMFSKNPAWNVCIYDVDLCGFRETKGYLSGQPLLNILKFDELEISEEKRPQWFGSESFPKI